MKAIRLYFVNDTEFPIFKRLKWEQIEVPLTDVLLQGIHPYTHVVNTRMLMEVFQERLNQAKWTPPELATMGYCREFRYGHSGMVGEVAFLGLLKTISEGVYFSESIPYLNVLELAKKKLRGKWSYSTAHDLLQSAYPRFPDLRKFLKQCDSSVKLQSFSDVGAYDLARMLSVEDFAGMEALLIGHALPVLNFRDASFLASVTDAAGRLRLRDEIRHFKMDVYLKEHQLSVTWHCERKGMKVRCRPDIGKMVSRREHARAFARKWGGNTGEYCFEMTLPTLERMVEETKATVMFAMLDYHHAEDRPLNATAYMREEGIEAYAIRGCAFGKCTADKLQNVLVEYGGTQSGTKEVLRKRLADVAAKRFRDHLPELDRYFRGRRFIRTGRATNEPLQFPVLEDTGTLRYLFTAMYVLRHLRANAILDTTFSNDTFPDSDMALALIEGRISVGGAFLKSG